MDEGKLVDRLISFGLTRQEATVYLCLYKQGGMTGYEVSKETGISRSNAYKALASLVDKGAANKADGQAQKITSVDVKEFCENKIRYLEQAKQLLEENMPLQKSEQEGYITITGDHHIYGKIKNMLENAHMRVYISIAGQLFPKISDDINSLLRQKKKVVILTDEPLELNEATVYITKSHGSQIGIISDSEYVLTGEFGKGTESTCLYSDQKNFVQVFKDSMANEIKLLEIGEQ